MFRKTFIVAFVLVTQIAAISWLIWRYERIVRRGTEVRFACQAYDPYDPFRGCYLRTHVSETCTNLSFQVDKNNLYKYRNKLFARLEKEGPNGLWRVAEVAEQPSVEGLWVRPIRSRVNTYCFKRYLNASVDDDDFGARKSGSGLMAEVTFPSQLFLNEKLAPEAENALRKAAGKTAVAVYRVLNREIVITDIEIEGAPLVSFLRSKRP